MVVITAADKESDSFFGLSVTVDAPVVTGVDPAVLRVNQPVTLTGWFFRTTGQSGPATIRGH